MIALKKTAFEIPLPVFIAAIVVGAGIITTTGLLTGLVARPANCIKRTTVEPPTTRVSGSSASVTTSAQSGSSTTRTSVASTVTSTAATTRTSTAATTRTSTAATTRTSTAATTRTSTAATTRTSVASTVTSTAATTRTSTAATTRTSTAATTRTSTAATTRTSVASSATTRTSIASSSSSAAPITGSVTTRQGTTSLPSTRPTTGPANTTVYRLPKTVSPSRYDLLLRFDFDPYNATASENSPTLLAYTGEVTIALTATQATNRIILHMDRNLVLTEAATVTNTDTSTPVTVTNSAYDNYQWYDLNLADNLVVGTNYAIALKFRGSTSRDGLYFHGYLEGNTKQRSVLGTRFLPNFARTAFPCFDEPGFKAIFAITIEHPATSKALSNFPELTSTPFVDAGKNKLRTVFTPSSFVMSPYQVGWAVVPDEFTSQQRAIAALGTTVSVWGRPSEISRNMGDFALEVAEASLTYMSIYSGGVNAPIPPKIDFVALPFFPDISSPSWGLNGFREDDIYYLDNENSKKDRQFIALIVAKEMAHIWFGNYITAEFWDDVWIQEGLAQLFQYRAIDATYPDWEIQNQFLVDVTMPALWRDGYEAAQPLKFEIHESVELKFLFTDLMYKKSAAIMRMFASAYGETAFKDGLTTLLTNNGFKSVNIDSFTAAFTAPNGWTISTKEYLEPWVTLDNAPEVVILMSVGGGVTNVSFVQARFLLSSIEFEPDSSKHIWPVYLNCKAGGVVGNPLGGAVVDFQFLLTGERDSYQLNAAYNWIKCNRDFDGYYISDYYKTLWESFEAVLLSSPETFSVGDRVHLIHSSFELAWLGTHSYSIPAYIIVYMESKETNLSPWRALIYHVNKLAVITEHRTSFRNLRASISITLLDAISRFGFDIYTDSTIHTEELLKLEFLDTLGRLQNVDALNNFTDLFKKIDGDYFIDPDHVGITLSSNLRALVYKYHLQNTYDFTDWFTIYTFYGITNDLREKEYAIDALANTRLTWLFDYQLDEVLFSADNHIPIEDAPRMISAIGNNPTGRYFAWYFVREYWGDLYLKGADMRKVTEAVNDITNSFDNLLLVDEVNSFFLTSYDFEAGDIREYISQTILENFLWTVDREADFKTYFFEIPRK